MTALTSIANGLKTFAGDIAEGFFEIGDDIALLRFPLPRLPAFQDNHAHAVGVGAPNAGAYRVPIVPDITQRGGGQILVVKRPGNSDFGAVGKAEFLGGIIE